MSRAFAPAKINLYLHVTGCRSDGYHLLDSLMVFANVGDRIEVRASGHLSLEISGPFSRGLSAGEDNLVLRAARCLAESADVEPRAAIRLTKNLPVASGIGGGSADCAATLRALIQHWNLELTNQDLHRLALSLGADIPACLQSRTCYLGGIGDELTPALSLPQVHLVLVNPAVSISTPDIFRARTAPFSRSARLKGVEISSVSPEDLANTLSTRHNDLTDPAVAYAPEVADVLSALAISNGNLLARMSGSGATCFGLYGNIETATVAAERLQKNHPNWWIKATSTLNAANTP